MLREMPNMPEADLSFRRRAPRELSAGLDSTVASLYDFGNHNRTLAV